MCEILVNDILDELRDENNRLLNDLCFERNLNTVLESIRNYSLVLIDCCKCDRNEDIIKKYNDLQLSYANLKTTKTVGNSSAISEQNIGLNCEPIGENECKNRIKSAFNAINNSKQIEIQSKDNKTSETTNRRLTEESTQRPENSSKDLQQIIEIKIKNILNKQKAVKNTKQIQKTAKSRVKRHKTWFEGSMARLSSNPLINPMIMFSNQFVCQWPECKRSFNQKNALISHQLIHTSSKQYKCPFNGCNKKFTLKCLFVKHQKWHLRGDSKDDPKNKPPDGPTDEVMSESVNQLKTTLNTNTIDSIETNSSTKTESNSEFSLITELLLQNRDKNSGLSANSFRFRCHECVECFETDSDLDLHLNSVHNVFYCSVCQLQFTNKYHFSEHMTQTHINSYFDYESKPSIDLMDIDMEDVNRRQLLDKQFKCYIDGCEESFDLKSDLELHLNCNHKAVDSCVCDYCPERFESNTLLMRHIKTKHNMRIVFKCDLCEYQSYRQYYLDKHRTIHYLNKTF